MGQEERERKSWEGWVPTYSNVVACPDCPNEERCRGPEGCLRSGGLPPQWTLPPDQRALSPLPKH